MFQSLCEGLFISYFTDSGKHEGWTDGFQSLCEGLFISYKIECYGVFTENRFSPSVRDCLFLTLEDAVKETAFDVFQSLCEGLFISYQHPHNNHFNSLSTVSVPL